MQTSEGLVVADYAVLGAPHDRFAALNGVRMESAAVSQWAQLSSVTFTREVAEDGELAEGVVRYRGAPRVRLAKRLNLGFKATWSSSVDPGTGETSGQAMTVVETRSRRPRPWSDHRDLLRAVLDLVGVASWLDPVAQDVSVRRDDAPLRTAEGTARGDKWYALVQRDVAVRETDPGVRFNYLFTWSDLGRGAIETWLNLRRRYPRAINPFVALPKMSGTYLENQLLQSAIALDALGTYLEDDLFLGAHRNKGGQLSYNEALRNIARDMKWHPLASTSEWIKQSNAAYMGAKHLDRDEVSANDMLDALHANAMVLRAWTAQRLGVTEERFRQSWFSDPIGRNLGAD
jgi:hypothetical protein